MHDAVDESSRKVYHYQQNVPQHYYLLDTLVEYSTHWKCTRNYQTHKKSYQATCSWSIASALICDAQQFKIHTSILAFWHLHTIKIQVSTPSLSDLNMIPFRSAKLKRASEWYDTITANFRLSQYDFNAYTSWSPPCLRTDLWTSEFLGVPKIEYWHTQINVNSCNICKNARILTFIFLFCSIPPWPSY